jgi:hypothetical protein
VLKEINYQNLIFNLLQGMTIRCTLNINIKDAKYGKYIVEESSSYVIFAFENIRWVVLLWAFSAPCIDWPLVGIRSVLFIEDFQIIEMSMFKFQD